ncbi:MAG: alpha-amylase family glycosyl hydrolase [Actinomycetota bacterium]|nr:alpha-amylase family glycosyl hydrolase [Actinomycetota bacterium]
MWLNPCFPSPNKDWGYDVADYTDIHPDYGTLEDAKDLIDQARRRDIRILFDLVPNHTSDEHPWFEDSRSSRDARHRDWYVWADPKPDGSAPNNWLSVFGGPAWEFDQTTRQYYLHNFLDSQPDLNWWNDEVRAAFEDILSFWFERGVAGFRIDVAHAIIKDRALRDNLPASEDDPPNVRQVGQKQTYSMNQPEVHEVLKRWRRLSDRFDGPPVLVGETWVLELERMVSFYGGGADELHLAFNFPFIFSDLDVEQMRGIVERVEELLPEASWPAWTGSNHDCGRFATRWCGNDERRVRLALMMLLTLRGSPFLLYGDEIGMAQREMARDEIRDPVGEAFWPDDPGRDHCRTPMQWAAGEGGGFTRGAPWLPLGDADTTNVEMQRADAGSVLALTRALISLRKREPALHAGTYRSLESEGGVWAYERGDSMLVILNIRDEVATVDEVWGRVCLTTVDAPRDTVDGSIELRPYEGVIVRKREA